MTQGLGVNTPMIGVLTASLTTGTMFDTYTTAKTVIPAANRVTLPPNFLYVGKALRITAIGAIKNVVTAQPTFTFQVQLGPTSNIVAWSSGAVTPSTTAHASLPFSIQIYLRVLTVGAATAATLEGVAVLTGCEWVVSGATTDSVLTDTTRVLPITTPAAGTGYDSTIANILDFFCAIQTSDANNGIQIWNYIVEDLN
jgi:hypothetical protein